MRLEPRQVALATLMSDISRRQDNGQRVPCVNARIAHWWTSEDPEMQDAAAAACSTCPALRNCRAYTEDHPEPAGVWAGVKPNDLTRRKTS